MSNENSSGPRLILIAIAIAAILAVPATFFFFFRAYQVPTGSMEKTLIVGDHLIGQIRGIGPITRGEIVLFHYPMNPRLTQIKRVIGMPGDRLKIVRKQLYLNGAPVQEAYVQHASNYMDAYRDNFPSEPNTMIYPPAQNMLAQNVVNGELVVPPGKYFLLGDNRDLSLDSRYWGFANDTQIFGRPLFVYLSPQAGRAFQRVE